MATKVEIPTELFELVLIFFQGDEKKTRLWFKTANPNLGYVSPVWMLQVDRKDQLLKFITHQYFDNYENMLARERQARKAYYDKKTPKTTDEFLSAIDTVNHSLRCRMAAIEITHWPRIKDLPVAERKPFRKWLTGQTVPMIVGLPYKEQDAYYQSDYDTWKYSWDKGKIARITD